MQIVGGVGGTEKLFAPTLSATTSTAGGFTFTITNYSALNTYVLTPSAGSASNSSGTITVSGLGNNASASVIVRATRIGFEDSDTTTASGTSFSQLATPTFSVSTSTSGGYTFSISNYSASNTYSFSVTNSGSATQSSGAVTVTGIGNATTATCTVTVSRSGFVGNSASTTGTSLTKLATPTFITYLAGADPGRYKYKITINNYDSNNTYTLSTSVGSASRSGSVITVNGSVDTQYIVVYVTASRAGYVSSDQAAYGNYTPDAPCPAYTWTGGQYIYDGFGCSACCYWRDYCNGNYGVVTLFYSGPCGYPGVYCAGCT